MLRAVDTDSYVGQVNCENGGVLTIHYTLPELANGNRPKLAALWAEIKTKIQHGGRMPNDTTLHQWEWGLPDVTIDAYVANAVFPEYLSELWFLNSKMVE